jgi:RNA polymerase sigma factor (sigma-70 family)
MTAGEEDERLSQMTTAWTLLRQAHGGASEEARAAQELLLARYRGAVFRYLRKAVGENDAEDLAQEFSLTLVQGKLRHAHPHRGRFRDYVRTILFRLVARHRRRGAKLPRPTAEVDAQAPDAGAETGPNFDTAWRDELLARAWEALRQTQPSWHEVLHFRARHPDLSSQEMARALGARLGRGRTAEGVRQTLHRARGKFAELLLDELRHSLANPTSADLLDELVELGLLDYCRPALDRRGP